MSKDYKIQPPPKETSNQPLFRVIYEIDVNAADQRTAAETALQMIKADDAITPILTILDNNGKKTTIDLSEYLEFKKITTGFVVQTYHKNKKGKFKCIDQEFVAGNDVQFEDLKGNSIEVPNHDYQPFNMSLVCANHIITKLSDVLACIDVGSEQSRQFEHEIKILNKLLKDLGWSKE